MEHFRRIDRRSILGAKTIRNDDRIFFFALEGVEET
ncbi:DUF4334 domain-containing protein [Pararhizobium sp. BT-229]|nr:DUF4334 domain-containing protein [Pararhizobium sp. BT-229]MCV9967451.1 DUF4334 domain-containing protein [Pararhizobium sp. BT-229]